MTSVSKAAPAQPAASPANVRHVSAPGGVSAWLVEEHAVPLIALNFAFVGGAAQDPAGKPGIAHLLSGLLDEGAGPYASDAFQTRLADKAIELEFHADRDTFRGSLKTLVTHADEAFDLLRLALTQARLDPDAIERVRAQVLAGLRHDANNPDSRAGRAFFAAAFPNHPYGQPQRGTPESVAAITREDLIRYRDTVMTRGNLFVSAVGAIGPDRLAGVLERVFGGLPETAALADVPPAQPAGLGQRTIVALDVPQSTVRFGGVGLARLDDDYMAAYVLNHILGGGVFSARLFKEVREKRGLSYGVSTSLVPMRHAALFIGGVATKNERVAESIAVISEEIAKLAADGPTEEELRLAKQYLIGSYALHFDTSTKIASQLLNIAVEGLGIDYVDRRNSLIDSVSMADVRRAGARFLKPDEMIVTVAGKPAGL